MKHDHVHAFWSRSHAVVLIGGLLLLLAACSSGKGPPSGTQPPVEVDTAMPVQRTFHTRVAAFGQLAADHRNALSLSLPQAGEIVATDVIAGQRVARDAALLKLATDPAARNAYLQAQSALRIAQDNLGRTERLRAEKLATNAQLDAAHKALADARAMLDAQARLGGAQAAVTLRAPAAGVVTALNVQRGQRIAAGVTLLQFTPASALAAQLGVAPEAASGIHVGMPVAIVPVYAPRGMHALHGTVAMVGGAVNPQTHLVDVVATLDVPVPLAAGTALSASIETSNFTAWSVPRDALQSDARGDFVYQIEHGKAHRIDVNVLAPDGNPIGVEGALDPHAPVITLGSYEVSEGDAVRGTSGATAHGAAVR